MEGATAASNDRDTEMEAGGSGRGGAPADLPLEEYLDRISGEIQERVRHQQAVLKRVVREGAGTERIPYCPLVACSRIEKLRYAIRETIGILEETRNAFKSRRLEVLRRKLTEILAES